MVVVSSFLSKRK